MDGQLKPCVAQTFNVRKIVFFYLFTPFWFAAFKIALYCGELCACLCILFIRHSMTVFFGTLI